MIDHRVGDKVQLALGSYSRKRHPRYSEAVGKIVSLSKGVAKRKAAIRFPDGFLLTDIAVTEIESVRTLTEHERGRRWSVGGTW